MALLDQTYTTDTLPEGRGYDLLPAGWYQATINSASLEITKNGTGQYIKLRFDVTGPTHQGRVVYTNLNIRNQNAKAEEIGLQQFGELLRAIGVARCKDTDELVGGQCEIKVSVRKSEEHGDQNDVKGYKAVKGGGVPPIASTFDVKPKPSDGGGGKSAPPWMKKQAPAQQPKQAPAQQPAPPAPVENDDIPF
jgi:hypothetical protein